MHLGSKQQTSSNNNNQIYRQMIITICILCRSGDRWSWTQRHINITQQLTQETNDSPKKEMKVKKNQEARLETCGCWNWAPINLAIIWIGFSGCWILFLEIPQRSQQIYRLWNNRRFHYVWLFEHYSHSISFWIVANHLDNPF